MYFLRSNKQYNIPMTYDNITKAIFISRPNRFIAKVRLFDTQEENAKEETVHVKNTGRCKELLIPGCTVYLEKSNNPNRKTLYDLIAVEKETAQGTKLFNIDSQAPNKVVLEWLKKQDYSLIKPEFTFGKSRFDFYLEKIDEKTGKTEKILMEVKGCTLEIDGIGYFPDAPTERGVKHLNELAAAISEGYKGILAFVIQMEGVFEVLPNRKTHPEFAEALENAKDSGVEVLFLQCRVKADELEIV